MKICPICSQTYNDNEQNYCLNDGATLTKSSDDAPPTLFMDPPRITNQDWQASEPANWQNPAPVSPWQNQANLQNQPFAPPMLTHGQDQTLPTVSLVLGILSFVLFCCYGGFPLGIAALITGYLGMNNANKDSMKYGGRGMAIAGLILGAVSVVGSFIFILFIILGSIK
ncbi:MAG: DUF4190 domain-containing protein [Pyrinomonadaceae bacterium]